MNTRRAAWQAAALAAAIGVLALAVTAPRTTWAQSSSADLVFGPYVNGVSSGGARVHWVAPAGVIGKCERLGDSSGTKVEMKTCAITGQTEIRHTAVVAGLKAGQQVKYAVTSGKARVEGAFQTAPPAGSREAFTFLTYSDAQTSPRRHKAVADAMMREATPAFTILTGDLTDDGPDWSLWQPQFFGPSAAVMRRGALWTVRGNHEKDAVTYKDLFDLPAEGANYSFDYANLHVIVLDQYRPRSEADLDSAGLAALAVWLEKDLAATKAEWKIACVHEPIFNVAGHGSTFGRAEILPVLEKYGVDIVVGGHSHLHERFVPIGPRGGKPIIHLVSPSSGGFPREPDPCPILAARREGIGYYSFTIKGNQLDLLAKAADGSVFDRLQLVKTAGAYQKEIMDAAVPTADAARLVKSFKVLPADVPARPKGGEALAASLRSGSFPAGAKVKVSRDPNGPWEVTTVNFVESNDSVPLSVVPPAGALLAENRSFSPELTVAVDIDYQGRKFSYPSVPLQMTFDTIRKLVPTPEPVLLAATKADFVIDGNLADWAGVPYLQLPSTKASSKDFKLTWRAEGIYGAVSVGQKEIRSDPEKPWDSDGLELYIESDAQRRIRVDTRGTPTRMYLLPPAEGAGGRLRVRQPYGRPAKEPVQAAWQRTADGYSIEFCIPAKNLGSSGLAANRKMGFHFLVRRAGEIVEQFGDTSVFRSVASTPAYWGLIQLADN